LCLLWIYCRSVYVEQLRKRQEMDKGSKSPDRDSSCDILKTRHSECCHT